MIDGTEKRSTSHGARLSLWYLLLLLPFPALLWVPFYNSIDPVILGFPFFYAYQMIWVILTAILTAFIYVIAR